METGLTLSPSVDWWSRRLSTRYAECGPPLFKMRSRVYARKSRELSQPVSPATRRTLAGSDPESTLVALAAAITCVLYRYRHRTESDGIVFGTPAPMSPKAALDVVPILVHVDGTTVAAELLERVRRSIGESFEHTDVPLDALYAALAMSEITNRSPLFPVVVQLGVHSRPANDVRQDITVTLTAYDSNPSLHIEYNAYVHDEATIARFAEHLGNALDALLADPTQRIVDVEYTSRAERAQLMAFAAGPPQAIPDEPVHRLFEAEVLRARDWEALVADTLALTYGEVNAAANRLANHLIAQGVTRGARVGLCVSASPALLIGLLGVLKSGAAVVPIVPSFPAVRNALTIEDSGMQVAVTESSLQYQFAGVPIRLVCLDSDQSQIIAQPATNPEVDLCGDDVAYILFTSGSTGRPKGVVMRHRSLVNLVCWQRQRSMDPAHQRTMQRTSIGFDVSFQEIFSTWAYGGCLVVASDDVRDDVSLLPQFIDRHQINRAFLPPVALEQLATAASHSGACPSLREVIVAGEQLHVSMAIRRFFRDTARTLDNHYGPTETHVATAYRLEGASTRWPAQAPIGRPIQNVRAYIVDQADSLQPVGVPGEILIGGVAPAAGYLTDTATAERFGADPFSSRDGDRVYRSGDIGRFLPDGTIEFIGRADHQVKIRGYRIELGEIEAAILQAPGVRQAAVTVYETETLGKQLAAYVVTDIPGTPDAAALRTHLIQRLPSHMIPSVSSFVLMNELPLTPSGKVNRLGLPLPGTRESTGVSAARGSVEEAIAAMWCKALGVREVRASDDFIELGGHSLVAIQLVSQLNEAFGVTIPLRTLLRGVTVSALAKEIEQMKMPRAGIAAEGAQREAAQLGASLQTVRLAPDLEVVCLHKPEAEYLYLDVFMHRTYERHGITYPAGGCFVDVGAHIGLFTLYAHTRASNARVFAFEPCPPLYEALSRNTAACANTAAFNVGLGRLRDRAALTFYPNLTGMSSFYPDQAQEGRLLTTIIGNLSSLGHGSRLDHNRLLASSDEYLDERLVAMTYECERYLLSDFIAEHALQQIDLLKIDVQKAELDVLDGLKREHWPRVKQVVVEVHDIDGNLHKVTRLLREVGFNVTVDQDRLHAGTVVHFVYAR